LAGIAGDERGVDDAVGRVDTFVLMEAVVDVAQRAVSALAQERGLGVDEVMASLLSSLPKDSGRSGKPS
jgi:hypothetical protein